MLRRHPILLVLFPTLATVVFIAFLSYSWALYPNPFSFMDTNISRLGRPSMNPDGYLFMAIACVLSNLLMLPYFLSLSIWKAGMGSYGRAVDVLIVLCVISVLGLFGLSYYNADLRMAHRIFGGVYFVSDALMMLLGTWIVYHHPTIPRWLAPFCMMAAVFSVVFLISSGKASWAEWTCVALNFAISIVLGIHGYRMLKSEHAV